MVASRSTESPDSVVLCSESLTPYFIYRHFKTTLFIAHSLVLLFLQQIF